MYHLKESGLSSADDFPKGRELPKFLHNEGFDVKIAIEAASSLIMDCLNKGVYLEAPMLDYMNFCIPESTITGNSVSIPKNDLHLAFSHLN